MAVYGCSHCGREIVAGEEVSGQTLDCAGCGEPFLALAQAEAAEDAVEAADEIEPHLDVAGDGASRYAIFEDQRRRHRKRQLLSALRISAWVVAGVITLGVIDFACRRAGWTHAVVDASERSAARQWLEKNWGSQWRVVKWSPAVDSTAFYSLDERQSDVLADSVLYARATAGDDGPPVEFIFVFRLGKLVGAGKWKFPEKYDRETSG